MAEWRLKVADPSVQAYVDAVGVESAFGENSKISLQAQLEIALDPENALLLSTQYPTSFTALMHANLSALGHKEQEEYFKRSFSALSYVQNESPQNAYPLQSFNVHLSLITVLETIGLLDFLQKATEVDPAVLSTVLTPALLEKVSQSMAYDKASLGKTVFDYVEPLAHTPSGPVLDDKVRGVTVRLTFFDKAVRTSRRLLGDHFESPQTSKKIEP